MKRRRNTTVIEANTLRNSLKALVGSFENLTRAQKIRAVAEVLREIPADLDEQAARSRTPSELARILSRYRAGKLQRSTAEIAAINWLEARVDEARPVLEKLRGKPGRLLGYARRLRKRARTTAAWMCELR